MQGEVAYRQLVLRDNGEALRLPLTAPINDLLGQLRKDNDPYLAYLFDRYRVFAGRGSRDIWLEPSEAQTFLSAAVQAAKGTLSPGISSHIGRLRFSPDGRVDVPDFEALAAWSLLESVRRQPLKVYTCLTCRAKWIGAPGGSRYCQRVAPGQVRKDCRTMAYEKRLAGDTGYRRYRREYKKLAEKQRRGTLDVVDLMHWRDQNSPADWLPFDEWKEDV